MTTQLSVVTEVDWITFAKATVGFNIDLSANRATSGGTNYTIANIEGGVIGSAQADTVVGGTTGTLTLQAGLESDTYTLNATNAKGSKIDDAGGSADKLELTGVTLEINTTPGTPLATAGNVGIFRQTNTSTSLIIDLNNDGNFNAADDLEVQNYFSATTNTGGTGLIEMVGTLTSTQILEAFPSPTPAPTPTPSPTPTPTPTPTPSGPATDPVAPPSNSPSPTPTPTPSLNPVPGTSGNDLLIGTTGADSVQGLDGNDQLYGLGGDDVMTGDTGNDIVSGNTGNDRISGGIGNDTGFGGQGNDTVNGDEGDDSLMGDRGNDTVSGGTGNDTSFGGQGNDSLIGGDGNDVLSGDFGTDTLLGGAGNDLFVLRTSTAVATVAQADLIQDYQVGVDIIGLTGNLTPAALTATINGNNTVLSITATNQILGVLTGQFTLQQLTFVSVQLPNGLI